MTYQVEYRLLAGGTRIATITQGQEVAIQDIKDELQRGIAVHATLKDERGVAVWSGIHI
jgi:hypothetical protein